MKAKDLAAGVLNGDRRSLAKAITLIEDARISSAQDCEDMLAQVMAKTGGALRLGISGIPGVGKSTFIESIGLRLVDAGKKVAVLAIDPSSPISGGSIMGDRTRMAHLSAHERAFIRPSPSGESVGGVARRTRESILLCEAAGYDVVIVETVGVGQGEYLVASMVDLFTILHMPGSGDDLQGIKRGILELADLVVVTKADGDLLAAAKLAASQLRQSLHMMHGDNPPPVQLASCVSDMGLDDVHADIDRLAKESAQSGETAQRRARQSGGWFDDEVGLQLRAWAEAQPGFLSELATIRASVVAGKLPASIAARQLLAKVWP